MRDCEWVEVSTGSLGHGLSFGVGMAIALKSDNSPAKVYVMIGDGECEEGTVWEAAMINILAQGFGAKLAQVARVAGFSEVTSEYE